MPGSLKSVRIRSARSISGSASSAVAAFSHFKAGIEQLQLENAAQLVFVFDDQDCVFSFACRLNGQKQAERAALARFAFDRHFTAMPVHYLRNDGQAQPDPVLFGGDEGIENGLDFVRRDAAAAVDDADFGLVRGALA